MSATDPDDTDTDTDTGTGRLHADVLAACAAFGPPSARTRQLAAMLVESVGADVGPVAFEIVLLPRMPNSPPTGR